MAPKLHKYATIRETLCRKFWRCRDTQEAAPYAAYLREKAGYYVAKRCFDVAFSLLMLILLWPLLLLIAAVIALDSRGAVLYVHRRVGLYGREIALLKFRTMCVGADGLTASFTETQRTEWEQRRKLRHDPRVTRVGHVLRRTGLDELPQLWNVLRGDLSLVGPRPIPSDELARYGARRAVFLSVPPGLTGYWQVDADEDENYEQRMAMELHYAANANLRWDARILAKTVCVMLTGKNRE